VERKEKGYYVSDEEVTKAATIAGIASVGIAALTILRMLFWPPVIRIKNDGR